MATNKLSLPYHDVAPTKCKYLAALILHTLERMKQNSTSPATVYFSNKRTLLPQEVKTSLQQQGPLAHTNSSPAIFAINHDPLDFLF